MKKKSFNKKSLNKAWSCIYIAYWLSFAILLYSAITESWIRFFVGIIFFIITALFNMGLVELEKEKK